MLAALISQVLSARGLVASELDPDHATAKPMGYHVY